MSRAQYWEGVAQEWRQTDRDRLWRSVSDAIHLRLLRAWGVLPAQGLVLKTDLFDEAATGALGRALAAGSQRLVGIDVSPTTARAAHAHLPGAAVLVADVQAVPFAEGSLDLIISDSTLDHFPDSSAIQATLVHLARLLRPGGKLWVTLDNPQHPVLWLRQRLPWVWLHRLGLVPYQLGATLSLTELAAVCGNVGLTVERAGVFMHCPRVLAVWLGRLLQHVPEGIQRAYQRAMLALECLSTWPGRQVSGRFVAVLAVKPAHEISPSQGEQA